MLVLVDFIIIFVLFQECTESVASGTLASTRKAIASFSTTICDFLLDKNKAYFLLQPLLYLIIILIFLYPRVMDFLYREQKKNKDL